MDITRLLASGPLDSTNERAESKLELLQKLAFDRAGETERPRLRWGAILTVSLGVAALLGLSLRADPVPHKGITRVQVAIASVSCLDAFST